MKRWLAIAVLVLVGLGGSSCDRNSARTAGRLTVDGRAEVSKVDGGTVDVTRSRTLKAGEQVRMVHGTATLSLGRGRQLELRAGTVLRLAVSSTPQGRDDPRGELVTGDVLVLARDEPATVVAGDSSVQVTGAARVSRGLAVVASVYEGAAGVESAGRSVSIPALRQRTVPAPGLPSRPTPIAYSESDPWDLRFLGDAIDLGSQLVSRSRGFSAQLGPDERTSPDLFRRILPALFDQPGFDSSLLDGNRLPGETLIGAAITLEGTKSEFADRWASVFSFHDDGAAWGVVALDQGVSREPLLTRIDAAIGRAPGLGAEAAAPAPTAPTSRTPGSPPPVPVPPTRSATPSESEGSAGGGETGTSGSEGTGGTGTATTEAPHERTTGPLNLGVPLVDETVNSVVEALSGLLRAIGR